MINKKFLKYQKMLHDSEEKYSKTIHYSDTDNSIYELKKVENDFFIDFVVIDAFDSKNGPSNWNFDLETFKLTQTSSIFKNNDPIATSLLLDRRLPADFNIYVDFASKSVGDISIQFKNGDTEDYSALIFSKSTIETGTIKLVQKLNGKLSTVEELSCDTMINILRKCSGYSHEANNIVEISRGDKSRIVIKYNKRVIFDTTVTKFGISQNSQISLSLNSQPTFVLHDLVIKNLNFNTKYEKETTGTIKEVIPIVKSNYKNESISKQKIGEPTAHSQAKLKYNPETNKFDLVGVEPSKIKNESEVDRICRKYEKDEYICNYLKNTIKEQHFDLSITKSEDIIKFIKISCMSKMKSIQLCSNILKKLLPVRIIYNIVR